jgi:hypothetical protein
MNFYPRRIAYAAFVFVFISLPAAAQTSPSKTGAIASVPTAPVLPAPGAGANWLYVWSGGSVTDSYNGAYIGAVAPFNGDLGTEGFALRWDFTGGRYSSSIFGTTTVPTRVDTDNAAFMVGYRKKDGDSWFSGYVGAATESHFNPDPTAPMRGTQFGVKAVADYSTKLADKSIIYAMGSFASPFTTGTLYAKYGYRAANQILVGPETSFFGDKAYRESRVGAFVGFELPAEAGEIDISAGYVHPYTGSPDGYYANINFSVGLYRSK